MSSYNNVPLEEYTKDELIDIVNTLGENRNVLIAEGRALERSNIRNVIDDVISDLEDLQ